MRAWHFEVLVEEPSMAAFLEAARERVLPADCTWRLHPFQGKQNLLAKLPGRLRGYANSPAPEARIIILIDRDQDDCHGLKSELERAAATAGLRTRAVGGAGRWQVATRIVIEELEAWYFGDWEAVKAAYPRVRPYLPQGLRNPDDISGGTWERFEDLLRKAGYFKNGLRKVEAARAIAQHFDPERNTSHSFRVFRDAIAEAVA